MTILSALAAASLFSLAGFWETRLSRCSAPAAGTFAVLGVGLLGVAPVAFALEGTPESAQLGALARSGIGGLLYAGAMGCFIIGVRKGRLSVVAPLAALEGGVAAVIAVILGERVSGLTGIGLGLAVVGAVLTAMGPGGKTSSGALWGLGAALLFGPSFLLYGDSQALSPFVVVFASRLASVAIVLPFLLRSRERSIGVRSGRYAAAAGLFDAAGFVALAYAVARGPVSVASVLVAQFATFAVLLGVIVLRERPAPHQLIGLASVIAGITVVAAVS